MNMRLTRKQHIEKHTSTQKPTKRITKRQAESILNRILRRQAVANGYLDTQKPKFIWTWEHDSTGGTVEGNSKSDARGEIKKVLGIPKDVRLPVGIKITKIGPNPGASMPLAAVIKSK